MPVIIPLSVALPLFFAFTITVVARRCAGLAAALATLCSSVLLALSLAAVHLVATSGTQVYAVGGWTPPIGISMVLDGLSAFMLVTVNLIALASVVFSVPYIRRFTGTWQFYSLFLLMVAGMNGVTVSGDMFNLFVYLELAAVTSYALVAFGTGKFEIEAAFKYAVMGVVGSLFILMGIIWLYAMASTLNMADLALALEGARDSHLVLLVSALFLLGFGLKSALVPFHAWLPDAHPSAPAPISAMLSGVLIKALGLYAMFRVFFGVIGMTGRLSLVLVSLGVISMLGGVLLAVGQWDLKRLLAYHSISQVGYVVLAVGLATPLGLLAGLFHLFNHSVFKALLFLDSGSIEYATGTRDLRRMGGLARRLPVTGWTTLIASMSISGIPPFNGFWSKLLIIMAAVQAGWYWAALFAVVASVLTLASFTKVMKYAFQGPLPEAYTATVEPPLLMRAALVLLAVVCILGGLLLLPEAREVFLQPAADALAAGTENAREILAGALR